VGGKAAFYALVGDGAVTLQGIGGADPIVQLDGGAEWLDYNYTQGDTGGMVLGWLLLLPLALLFAFLAKTGPSITNTVPIRRSVSESTLYYRNPNKKRRTGGTEQWDYSRRLRGRAASAARRRGPFTGLKDGSICERCSYCVALGVPCRTQKRENTFRQTYDIITLAGMKADEVRPIKRYMDENEAQTSPFKPTKRLWNNLLAVDEARGLLWIDAMADEAERKKHPKFDHCPVLPLSAIESYQLDFLMEEDGVNSLTSHCTGARAVLTMKDPTVRYLYLPVYAKKRLFLELQGESQEGGGAAHEGARGLPGLPARKAQHDELPVKRRKILFLPGRGRGGTGFLFQSILGRAAKPGEIGVGGDVIGHRAVVELLVGLEIEIAGAGQAEEDRLRLAGLLAAQGLVDGDADGVAALGRGEDALDAGELLGGLEHVRLLDGARLHDSRRGRAARGCCSCRGSAGRRRGSGRG
jgi:hypothetical protein